MIGSKYAERADVIALISKEPELIEKVVLEIAKARRYKDLEVP